jgi:hypothetical protein
MILRKKSIAYGRSKALKEQKMDNTKSKLPLVYPALLHASCIV